MAKENTVRLFGIIKERPVIKYKATQNRYEFGKVVIETLRMHNVTADLKMKSGRTEKWDEITVYAKNAKLIQNQMKQLCVGDIIYVKGTFVTQDDYEKKFYHSDCNDFTSVYGSDYYIDPIDITVFKKENKNSENNNPYQYLRSHSEISNEARLIGTVCKTIEYTETEENGYTKKAFTFTLASNRNRHILEDAVNKKTDYPILKCYGEKAELYHKYISVGTEMYVYGGIQSRRNFSRNIFCNHCGDVFTSTDSSMELVPFRIIPINNAEDFPIEMEENTVYLFGWVKEPPYIINDSSRVLVKMECKQRLNTTKELAIAPLTKEETVVLKPSTDRMKKKILNLNVGDMILLKGTLGTLKKEKKLHCKQCDYIEEKTMHLIYVDPVDIVCYKKGLPPVECKQELNEHLEISNELKITGTVITEPEMEEIESINGKTTMVCRFQIESKRNRYEKEQNCYPYVCVYHQQAEECYEAIHIGSKIFITGAIQHRTYFPVCACCEEKDYTQKDAITEIVPYNIEYVSGCDVPESKREVCDLDK